MPVGQLRRPLYHQRIARHLLAMNVISFGTTTFRKSAFEKIGPFNENLKISEDVDWLLRGVNKCCFANIPRLLMNLRQTSKSRSRLVEGHDRQLVECLIATLSARVVSPGIAQEASTLKWNEGLVHYYYGDMHTAKKKFASLFLIAPFDLLTLRYLLVSALIPPSIFARLRRNAAVRGASELVRKLAVWKDVIFGGPTA